MSLHFCIFQTLFEAIDAHGPLLRPVLLQRMKEMVRASASMWVMNLDISYHSFVNYEWRTCNAMPFKGSSCR